MAEHDPRSVLNRVLFSGALPTRTFVSDSGARKRTVVDGSGLPFIVEELIALSAVEVVLPDTMVAASFVSDLDPLLKERVKVISGLHSSDITRNLCGQVGDEFGIEVDHSSITFSDQIDAELSDAFRRFWTQLPAFLLGMEHGVQVDINVQQMRDAARKLRTSSRSERTRGLMAAFEGVLATYSRTDLPGLAVSSSARTDLPRLLRRLVEDEMYRDLSTSVHDVSFPEKRERALQMVRRFVEDLAARSVFKHLFTAGTKAVETIARVPMPEREALSDLLGARPLPTVVSLRGALATAHELWEKHDPPFVPPKHWRS